MSTHRRWLVLVIVAASASEARADVFAFKDLEGFEKCMRLDHLVETTRTADGEQHRMLDQNEIQERCVDAAVKLLGPTKDKDLMFTFVKTTKQVAGSRARCRWSVSWSIPRCRCATTSRTTT